MMLWLDYQMAVTRGNVLLVSGVMFAAGAFCGFIYRDMLTRRRG